MKRSMRCSDQKRRRFLGGRRSREARKSAGMSTASARAKRSCQEPGLRERMTSPVSGSLRMNTSGEEKRKSEGKRTAWLRPFLKSLAVLRTGTPGKREYSIAIYTMIYYKFFENKRGVRSTHTDNHLAYRRVRALISHRLC